MPATPGPVRSVLVSGASTGIGRAVAVRLAAQGWLVLAGVRHLADAPPAPSGGPGTIRALRLDVTDAGSVGRAHEQVVTLLAGAPLTALVNNAGIGVVAPLERVDLAAMRAVWEVNVLGVVRLSQAFLPLMAPGSRLVVVGSVGDRVSVPFGGPLTSSKWAVASVAEAFRLELAVRGIRVVLVEPGSIRTDAVAKVEAAAAVTAADLARSDPALAERFGRAAAVAVEQERRGSSPDVVAVAISRVLHARRPPTRVLVGRHARLLATAALLPDRVLDPLRLRLFRQPATTGPAVGRSAVS